MPRGAFDRFLRICYPMGMSVQNSAQPYFAPVPDEHIEERNDKRSPRPSAASLHKAFGTRSKREREKGRLLTASELCDRCGITKTEFRKLVNRGIVRSCARNQANWTLYHEDDVLKIQKIFANRLGVVSRREGLFSDQCEYSTTEALKVIELLETGMSMDRVFLAVKLHPVIVQSIQRDWARMQGGVFVPQPILDEINRLPLEGQFPISSARELYEVLELASKEKKCGQCKKRAISHTCLACAKRSLYQAKRTRSRSSRPIEADEPTFETEE